MALTDLGCAGCGAPLKTANADGRTIVCPYCQREHVFEAPPPQPRQHEHPVGSRVVVQWGGRWWAAEVVAVEGRERWRIHYLGWSSSWDEVVGPERIRPANAAPPARSSGVRALAILAAVVLVGVLAVVLLTRGGAGAPAVEPDGRSVDVTTPLSAGQPVQVEWNGSWYEGRIRAVHPDGRVRVHYEGWEDSYDEDVGRERILLRPGGEQAVEPAGDVAHEGTALEAGQRVQIEWMGAWYDGRVLETRPDGGVRVRYEGWGESYDEDVPRSRVRVF